MYEVFEEFLNVRTWYTRHNNDVDRFNEVLNKVVGLETFSPEAMGDYFIQHHDLNKNLHDHEFNKARREYVTDAWAIKRFLETTRR